MQETPRTVCFSGHFDQKAVNITKLSSTLITMKRVVATLVSFCYQMVRKAKPKKGSRGDAINAESVWWHLSPRLCILLSAVIRLDAQTSAFLFYAVVEFNAFPSNIHSAKYSILLKGNGRCCTIWTVTIICIYRKSSCFQGELFSFQQYMKASYI